MLSLGTLGLQPCWPPLLALGLKKYFYKLLGISYTDTMSSGSTIFYLCVLYYFSCLLTMMEILILYISPVLGAKRSDHL